MGPASLSLKSPLCVKKKKSPSLWQRAEVTEGKINMVGWKMSKVPPGVLFRFRMDVTFVYLGTSKNDRGTFFFFNVMMMMMMNVLWTDVKSQNDTKIDGRRRLTYE